MATKEQQGSFYAILSGFLYGFIGYFGMSAINGNLSASNMLFWRFAISSIAIFLLMITQIQTFKGAWQQLLMAFLGGVIFYGFSTLLYFYASLYIGSGLAMVIFFTYPVIIMLLNYFFYGQAIPRIYYFASFIILVGMAFLVNMSEFSFDLMGLFIGLASSFFYALYIISSKNSTLSPNMSTLMVSLGCMTTSFVVACCSNSFMVPTTVPAWVNLLGIGIVATVIPILLMLHSLRYISSEKASILSVLEPVFVVILGVLLLHESLEPRNVLGIVFILAGALLTLFSHKISAQSLHHWFLKLTGRKALVK